MTDLIDYMNDMSMEEKEQYRFDAEKIQCVWCDRIFTDASFIVPGSKCRDCKAALAAWGNAIKRIHWTGVKNLLTCVYCGLTGRPECMEFDHYDPHGKIHERNAKRVGHPGGGTSRGSQGVAQSITAGSNVRYSRAFYEEVMKCIVICSNCHAEKTKHEYTYEDAYRSDEVKKQWENGNQLPHSNNRQIFKRDCVTARELISQIIEPAWNNTINREVHMQNLKVLYEMTFSFYMSQAREAWKTSGNDYLNWEWSITSSPSGERGSPYIHNGKASRGIRNKEAARVAGELLTFECDARIGKDL